jgi:hypothetical protein
MTGAFVRCIVGLDAGFFGRPDIEWRSVISRLRSICRVCRVITGGESCEEFDGRELGVE